jgi:hypothetical protein
LSNSVNGVIGTAGGELFVTVSGGGVYRSANDGVSWTALNGGLTNLSVTPLAVDQSGFLYTGSSGSGVFRTTSSVLGTDIAAEIGWNLISVPRLAADFAAAALFPDAAGIFSYSKAGYASATVLANGPGYWALFGAPSTTMIFGGTLVSVSVSVDDLAVGEGRWVLIGSVTTPLAATAVATSPPGLLVPGSIFSYDGAAYLPVATLEPGRGYWALVTGNCAITLGSP